MKFLPALVIALIVAGMFHISRAEAYEEPVYETVVSTDAYEIRRYAPYLVAQTRVQGRFGAAGGQAFRILADYIFGNNVPGEEMAMTAPVISRAPDGAAGVRMAMTAPVISQQADGEPEAANGAGADRSPGYVYQFVMERKYSLDTLPRPADERVEIVEIPERLMAVRRFSGRWTEKRISAQEDQLVQALQQDGYAIVGEPMLARYDPPIKPWFLRRNEILLQIAVAE